MWYYNTYCHKCAKFLGNGLTNKKESTDEGKILEIDVKNAICPHNALCFTNFQLFSVLKGFNVLGAQQMDVFLLEGDEATLAYVAPPAFGSCTRSFGDAQRLAARSTVSRQVLRGRTSDVARCATVQLATLRDPTQVQDLSDACSTTGARGRGSRGRTSADGLRVQLGQ